MEIWDVYDKNRIPTGKTVERGAPLDEGEYRLAIHLCIFNKQGQMLIQQRQPFKKGWSNMWDVTVGGSAIAGESSWQAVQRELLEELGLAYDFSNTRPQLTVNFHHGFNDIFLVSCEVDLSTLKLAPDEVQSVRWATQEQILQMIDSGEFIPYRKSWIQFLFDSRCSYGTHFQKDPT